jgi:hypothetical protein
MEWIHWISTLGHWNCADRNRFMGLFLAPQAKIGELRRNEDELLHTIIDNKPSLREAVDLARHKITPKAGG